MKKEFYNINFKQGFTLVELLIVVAIIGVMVGLFISQYSRSSEDAKKKRALADLKNICNVIKSYNTLEKKKFYKVKDLNQLVGKYMQKLPTDPWGRPYKADGTYVFSYGPDGIPSDDDIKLKYERDSIVENSIFVASQGNDGIERPGGWKMNPPYDPNDKEHLEPGRNYNYVKLDKSNSTSGGNSVLIK